MFVFVRILTNSATAHRDDPRSGESGDGFLGIVTLRFGITQKWLRNFKRNVLAPEFMYLDVDMAAKKQGLR